jgi:hypothetical protein
MANQVVYRVNRYNSDKILSMFSRVFIQLGLVLIFAFTQIGVLTHEISHINELTEQSDHSNPDKNTAKEQCGQCIGSAQVTSSLPTQAFEFHLNQAQYQLTKPYVAYLASVLVSSYSARAPPLALNH